jgi:hypothetical protein
MHEHWQIEQGARCGCRGTDEWCGCQNVRHSDRTKFNGTPEQLMNALREAERRGGMMGAICAAAADEIDRLKTS